MIVVFGFAVIFANGFDFNEQPKPQIFDFSKLQSRFVYEDIELDDFSEFCFGDGCLKHYCLRTASLAELMTLAG